MGESAPSHGPLARRAHEAAVLLAFETDAVEELLPHGGVVTVADDVDESPAIVAEVLHGLLARHVALVGHEDREDEDEEADDQGHRQALEAPFRRLEGKGGPRDAHGPPWTPPIKKLPPEHR